MAVLPKIFPNNTYQYSDWQPVGSANAIDNGVDTPDGVFLLSNANSTGFLFFLLANMPTDFVKMLTLTYNIRYKIDSLSGDTETLFVQIFKADDTTALTNEMTVTVRTASVAVTNSGNIAFTGVSTTATKNDWNNAKIKIRSLHSANMGADGSYWSIDEVELNGTYQSYPNAPTLTAPTDTATNQSVTPTLSFNATDAESDTLEYEVQVDTVNTFDSSLLMDRATGGTIRWTFANEAGFPNQLGQSFTGNGNKVTYACFTLRKLGTPTGDAVAKLYAHTGTYGSGGAPTGTALATSNPILATSISTLDLDVEFTFGTPYQTVNGTKYCIVLEYLSGASSTSNTIQIMSSAMDVNTHSGNICQWYFGNSSWSSSSSWDTNFSVLTGFAFSTVDAGFTAGHPYASGASVSYTVGQKNVVIDSKTDLTVSVINYSTTVTRVFQSFTGNGSLLDAIIVRLSKVSSPTGNIVIKLYAHSGTYGTSSLPTGSALATSDTIDISTLSTLANTITFNFSTPYTLVNGTKYTFAIEHSGDNSNYLKASWSDGHSGNAGYFAGAWTLLATNDLYFIAVTKEIVELTAETQYYWRARAIDPLGSNTYGSWSATRSFTTIAGNIGYVSNSVTTTSGILTAKGKLLGASNTVTSTTGVLTVHITIVTFAGRSDSQWRLTTVKTTDTNLRNDLIQRHGQILNGFSGIVDKIGFTLKKTGTPVFDIVAKIYSVSGGLPNTVLQTSSTTILASSLTGADAQYYFQFDKTTNYSQDIYIGFEITNHTSSDISNRVDLGLNQLSALYQGTRSLYYLGTWINYANEHSEFDLILVGATSSILIAKGNLQGVSTTATSTASILIGKGSLLGTVTTGTTTTAILTNGVSVGVLVGVVNGISTTSAILRAKGIVQAVSNMAMTVSGVLQARGSLIVTVNTFTITTSQLIAKGKIIGTSTTATTTSGTLRSKLQASGAVNTASSLTGILSAKGRFLGTANSVSTTSLQLTAKGKIQGAVTTATTTSATLSTDALQGAVNTSSTLSGILTAKGKLQGVVNTATTASIIVITDAIQGTVSTASIVTGTLTAKGTVLGAVNGNSSVTGLLSSKGKILGTANSFSTVTGLLSSKGKILGTANSVSTNSLLISAKGKIEGVVTTATTASIIVITDAISGTVNTASALTGTLTAKGAIQGTVNTATTTSLLIITDAIQGTVSTASVVTAILTAKGKISGTANSISTTSLLLSAKGKLQGVVNTTTTSSIIVITDAMQGTADGSSSLSATLTAKGALQGFVNTATTASIIIITNTIQGITNASSLLSGTLSAKGNLVGISNTATTTAGVLTAKGKLQGVSEVSLDIEQLIENTSYKLNGSNTELGQSFLITGLKPDYIDFRLTKSGLPNVDLRARIYSLDVINRHSILLSESTNVVASSSLTAIKTNYRFYFDKTTYNQKIGILLGRENVILIDVSNNVDVWRTDSNVYPNGSGLYTQGVSKVASGGDHYFKLHLADTSVQGDLKAKGKLQGVITTVTTASIIIITDAVSGTVSTVSTLSGTLTAKGALQGAVNTSTTANIIVITDAVQGTITASSSLSGTLSAKGEIYGTANSVSTVTGTLLAKAKILGTANSISTTSLQLSSKGELLGSANGVSTVTGILTAKGSLQGIVTTATTASIIVITDAVQGTVSTVSTLTGILTAKGKLAGVVTTATTASIIVITDAVSGTVNTASTLSGILLAKGKIQGIANTATSASTTLSAKILVSATINSLTTTSATLIAHGALVGTVGGFSVVECQLSGDSTLNAQVNTATILSATLSAYGVLSGSAEGFTATEGILNGVVYIGGESKTKTTLESTLSGTTHIVGHADTKTTCACYLRNGSLSVYADIDYSRNDIIIKPLPVFGIEIQPLKVLDIQIREQQKFNIQVKELNQFDIVIKEQIQFNINIKN